MSFASTHQNPDLTVASEKVHAFLGVRKSPSWDSRPHLFNRIICAQKADSLISDLESQVDFSDSWPFHEWVKYGLTESPGVLVAIRRDDEGHSGFSVSHIIVEHQHEGDIQTTDVTLEIERVYVAGKKRNIGLGYALLTEVLMRLETSMVDALPKKWTGPYRKLNVTLKGDSFSSVACKLFGVAAEAIERQGVLLLARNVISEFQLVNMVEHFDENDDA